MSDLDFDGYLENLEARVALEDKIARLESFEKRTENQDRQLEVAREAFRLVDESIKAHKRACITARVSFDGTEELDAELGHTPINDLDGNPADG